MNTLIKADVFFFITAIAVVILTVLITVLCAYLISIFKDIKYISQKAKTEAELISEDLSQLRQNVRDDGAKLKYFLNFFQNLKRKSAKHGRKSE